MEKAHSDYPLLRPFLYLFNDGSKTKGLAHLKLLSYSDDKILNTESNYFLMKIYYEIESDKQSALAYSNHLKKNFKSNYVFHFYNHKIKSKKTDKKQEYKTYKKQILRSKQLIKIQKEYFLYLLRFKY